MTPPDSISTGTKGDTFCRPAEWTDVAKFFLLNYGLHAFTALSEPGSGIIHTILSVFGSLLMPYGGMATAITAILSSQIPAENSLERAANSSALCVVRKRPQDRPTNAISPSVTHVHGQIPIYNPRLEWSRLFECEQYCRLWKAISSRPGGGYYLARMPVDFRVEPLVGSGAGSETEDTNIELACSHSPLKAFAAIFQVVYGSFELYRARGHQLAKYGYAAYSFTVVPYILMSLVNLLAAVLQPQYPSMYVVLHQANNTTDEQIDEKKIGGAVGRAYGDLEERAMWHGELPSVLSKTKPGHKVFVVILFLCLMAAPYVIMKASTNFEYGESTKSQRIWMMVWLVFNQVAWPWCVVMYSWVFRLEENPFVAIMYLISCTFIFSVPSIGSFVVVGKMMLSDQVCTLL